MNRSSLSRWLDHNYVAIVVAAYAFTPLLRRYMDYLHGSFQQVSPVMVLPIAVQIPLLLAILRGGRLWRAPSPMLFCAFAWTGACAYGALIGYAMGNGLGAFYDAANFALPLWSGLWMATQDEDAGTVFARFAKALLLVATIAGAYGIYQYVSPPKWDVLWMQGVNMVSLGKPQAFGFRVFGTANDDVIMSLLLLSAFALNLNGLRSLRPLTLAQMMIIIAALGLTFARQAWLGLAISLVAYAILSPRRARVIPALFVVSAVAVGVIFNLSAILGAQKNPIIDRIATLGSLGTDQSLTERGQFTSLVLEGAVRDPIGYGFGSLGHGALLNTGLITVTDNGYAVRIYELGIPGSLLFFGVIFGSLVLILIAFVRRWDSPIPLEIAAPVAAYSFALVAVELATDVHLGLVGVIYWTALGIFFKGTATSPQTHLAPPPRPVIPYGVRADLAPR